MGIEPDLRNSDRETLLAIIAELRATVARLERQVADLEGRASSRPRGMPGNKIASSRKQPEEAKQRKKRERGYARKKSDPTRQEFHALDHCPECGTAMTGGTAHRRREVIDIPQLPFEVVEHVLVARRCAKCRKRRTPGREVLRGKAVGRGRFGLNLVSLVTMLREEFWMPLRAVQRYLRMMHGLEMSEGAIVGLTKKVAGESRPALAEILKGIRESGFVHMDETGWREGGVNGYGWVAATPEGVYFVRRGRNKEVVDELLGAQFCGVVTCDFYAAYNHHQGLKQRCWVHLLRDIDGLAALYPEDKPLAAWRRSVRNLWVEAKEAAAEARPPPSGFEALTTPAQLAFEQRLLELCRPCLDDHAAPHRKLAQRIERFIKELFVFVSHPDVPSDNNAAERSLRHLVVGRKISGGTRTKQGSDVRMALASLYGTWRLRGLNPFDQCRQLLGYHQL